MKTPIQRDWWTERRAAAALSLAAAWAFFAAYLPPLSRIHLIWDFDAYHHPLINYGFQRLRAGAFPEWDPSIYCGVGYAGNIQAGLFYPGTWLLYLVNWTRPSVSFWSLHALVALHFALALLFAYLWLRERETSRVASGLGALSYAFSGFFLNEVQHLGATEQIAWIPFAFWGLTEASRRGSWRPLWKVAAGSALAFLAGFPFVWVVLLAGAIIYAAILPGRRWLVPGCVAAIAFSVVLAMVQILPAREAAAMKVVRQSYGFGGPSWGYLPPLFAPNFFDQARRIPPGIDQWYFYLGGIALFALLWWARRGGLRAAAPGFLLAGAAVWIMIDPGRVLAAILVALAPAHQMVRDWNFLALIPAAAALIVAASLDDFLKRGARPTRPAAAWLALAAMAFWIARQGFYWTHGGYGFLSGWASLAEAGVVVALIALGLFAYRGEQRPRWKAALLAALFLLVQVDYQAYGTNRRFDAGRGDRDRDFREAQIPRRRIGLEQAIHDRMTADRVHRFVLNDNPTLVDVRYYGLSSPQGSDPMFPEALRQKLEADGAEFTADRTFRIGPDRASLLQQTGVRYIMTHRGRDYYKALVGAPRFRLLGQEDVFFAVFEYLDAQPIYHWDAGAAACHTWTPETRACTVDSAAGGAFALSENRFPGWSATVDGRPVPIEPWATAFQQVRVPPGRHEVRFEYRAPGLRAGALVSLAGWATLLAALWWSAPARRSRPDKATAG